MSSQRVCPLLCVVFFVLTRGLRFYAGRCFLEDESENNAESGLPSFATGELAQFMSSTKTIADIEQECASAPFQVALSARRSPRILSHRSSRMIAEQPLAVSQASCVYISQVQGDAYRD